MIITVYIYIYIIWLSCVSADSRRTHVFSPTPMRSTITTRPTIALQQFVPQDIPEDFG